PGAPGGPHAAVRLRRPRRRPGYAVLGMPNAQLTNSSATVAGDVGISQGGKFKNAGPAAIAGTVYEATAGQYSGPGRPTGGLVTAAARLSRADADALDASARAAALAPTRTLDKVNKPTVVTGNGGLNVVFVGGDVKASLTLSGTAADVFVVNVAGTVA